MCSVLNTLSEYIYFYIPKNITSYNFLLVFKIFISLRCILNASSSILSKLFIINSLIFVRMCHLPLRKRLTHKPIFQSYQLAKENSTIDAVSKQTFTCSKSTIGTLEKRCEICSKLIIKTPERRK